LTELFILTMENSSEDPAKKTLARLNQLTSIATAGSSEAPNIFKTDEHYTLESTTDSTREIMLAEFQRRKRARMMTLPTDDYEVKALLRQLGHPICLFGEDKPDRRERLRKILSLMAEEEAHRILRREEPAVESQEDETTWYHEGSEALKSARIFIAQYSLPRAKERLLKAREQKNIPGQERAIRLQETHKWISTVTNFSSQIGDVRPVVYCDFSPDSKFIATAGWSGLCKIWSVPDCKLVKELRGHSVSACCVRFHPKYEENHMLIGSCDQEGRVKLWSMNEEKPLLDIDDCAPYRVSRLAFHPSGRFIAYTCFDCSWRLYDVEVKQEILYQEGHSKSVYDIAFQCDGSVALTGGLDAYGRVWDLRTGRCVMFLESHQRSILTVDFLPNGYQMVSGSADNSCKIWDLRMRRCIYTLPAHNSLVSKVCIDTAHGGYLLTGSYDCTIKLWTNPGWQPLKTLQGHESKVMCASISPDGNWIASSSYDRTFKLWAPESPPSAHFSMLPMDYFWSLLLFVLSATVVIWQLSSTYRYIVKMTVYYSILSTASVFITIMALARPMNLRNFQMVRYVLYWVERLYQLKIIVRGASHLESSQPLIVVCNHQSSLDIIPMMRIWPERCAPLAKKSLKYMGFFGIASILCGCVFIDRFDKNNARKVISSTLKHIIEQKIKLWVFPEGTRNRDSGLLPFKKGAFYLAIQAQIPIVPVVFSSYRNFYSKLERRFDSGGLIIVEVLPPIDTTGSDENQVAVLAESTRLKMLETFSTISEEVSELAVQVIISVSPDDCKAVGFTPNLVCSSCSELSQYGLKELEPNCRQCCAKDELYDAINQYPQIHGKFDLDAAFVKSEKPKEWPGFRVRYERGANPVIKLFNEKKEVVETLGIDKWNTDTIVEFLNERGAVKGRKTWVALDVHENRILIIILVEMDLEFVLQALAILFHVFFMVLYPPISCFLVYKLLTGGYFTILLGYLIWLIYDWQTPSQGSRLSMFLRRAYYMKLCQQYFPITLRKTAELDPSKNYIIGHHPHGILSFGATNFCQEYSGFSSLFPGMQSYLSTLKMNFLFPIRREYFEFLGVTDCSKNSIHYLLSQPKKGTAVAVVIGGAEEALEAHPGKHRVVLKSRKGFIKLALHCGATLAGAVFMNLSLYEDQHISFDMSL
ncbi:U4/U6 small nuclear ribonucleoprotein Prp4, partial [Trichinella sp. T6]